MKQKIALVFTLWVSLVLLSVALEVNAAEPLKLGTLGHSLGFLQADVAEAKGWLDTTDLQTKILYFKSGKDCATALLQGELDGAILGVDHAITGQKQGIPIKQLMLFDRVPGWTLVVSKEQTETVTGPADLKGKKIGVTSPGSATHILTAYLMDKYGVPSEEYTIVKAGVATLPDILRKGGIDAGMALEPHGSSLTASGDAVLLVDFRSAGQVQKHLGSLYPMTCLLVRQDVVDRVPKAVQDLTTAMVWACKWLQTASADDVVDLLPADYVPKPELWHTSYGAFRDVFSPDGKNDVEGIRAVVTAQVVFGKLGSTDDVDIDALYTDRFWKVANQTPLPTVADVVAVDSDDQRGITGIIVFMAVVLVIIAVIIVLVIRRKTGASEES